MAEVPSAPGSFEARYLAFLETVVQLRPKLHRFCARMTGSVLDGEDVVQDALFDAYRRLETFDDSRPLGPWLFRIAHNRCIDFLRRRDTRRHAEDAAAAPPVTAAVDPPGPALGRAVERLVRQLPPKERACVLLKDVFEYTIEEIADLVESTPSGVKAALHRGREKLVAAPRPAATPAAAEIPDDERRLLRLYVERFNRQDWQGLRDLIAADATLRVADRFHGRFGSLYVDRYARLTPPLRAVLSDVDGEPVIALYREGEPLAPPRTFVRLSFAEGRITGIADYTHCPWVMAAVERVSPIPPDA
ncbi:MAG: sigma-70 family RNA polymerase sigma factor [Vicinamibacteraceae bacterium]